MYITNANLRRLLSSIESANTNGVDVNINNPIINDILSDEELEDLKEYKAFFLGRQFNIEELRPVKVVDTYKYVKPPSKPAYHRNSRCARAHADFESRIVPEVIRARGKDAVNDYRRRVEGLDFSKMEDCITLAAELGIEPRHITEIETEENSGVDLFKIYKDVHSMSINELDGELIKMSDLISQFSQQSQTHNYIYGLRFLEPHELMEIVKNQSNIAQIGKEFASLKTYIKEILTEKFKKESGFDQSAIEENLLEKLNFVSCRSCLNANNGNFMGF